VAGTRFSVPIPQRDVAISSFAENFKGTLSFIKVDPGTGRMNIAFQVLMPGFNYDLAHCGKGPSHGWCFYTSYNSEQAHTLLERNASKNDKDFVAAVNWERAEECVAQGKGETLPGKYNHNVLDEGSRIVKAEVLSGTTVLKPEACEGLVYFLPTPKSPHGVDVDPTGRYIVAGGKLSSTSPVHSFENMKKAIDETERRRNRQIAHNLAMGITPKSINKQIRDMIDGVVSDKTAREEERAARDAAEVDAMSERDLGKRIKTLERQMLEHAKNLEFEKAARVRDQLSLLREQVFGAAGHDSNVVPISGGR